MHPIPGPSPRAAISSCIPTAGERERALRAGGFPRRRRGASGIALVEVLLSIVILGLTAGVISQAFNSGYQAMDARIDRARQDSIMKSKMEYLLAMTFADLSDGSQIVTVDAKSYTVSWTFTPIDLNGDSVPEASAKLLTVSVGDRSILTIVCDHTGSAQPRKI